MLGKLLKYDMKSLGKSLLPGYVILLIISTLARVLGELSETFTFLNSITPFIFLAFILGIVGIGFYTFIAIVIRFYKNIVKEEGYLTNTLPVDKHSIVLSKLISSNMYYIFTTIIMVLSFFIVVHGKIDFGKIGQVYEQIINALHFSVAEANMYIIFMIILTNINNIIMVYLAIAFGQTKNDKKVMYSVVSWIVIYMVLQTVSGMFGFTLALFNEELRKMSANTIPSRSLMIALLFPTTIVSIIEPVIMYFLTVRTLNKSLNVE
jgi:hypothetical protein